MAMQKNILSFLVALALCWALSACSDTVLTNIWTDPGYKAGPVKKLMYVGMCEDWALKNVFEKSMGEKLRQNGVDAVPSQVCFPNVDSFSKEAVSAELKRQGVDAILIAWLIEIKEQKEERKTRTSADFNPLARRGGRRNFYDVFRDAYAYQSTLAVGEIKYQKEIRMLVDSKLYDAESGEMIWQIQTETVDPANMKSAIEPVTDQIIKNLRKQNLI